MAVENGLAGRLRCAWSRRSTVRSRRSWKKKSSPAAWFEPKVVYGYFPAQSEGNDVIVYEPLQIERQADKVGSNARTRTPALHFPAPERRPQALHLRFLRAESHPARWTSSACRWSPSAPGHRSKRKRLFEGGEYTNYLYLHGLSVETAEALAEYLHKKMREELGIAGEDSPHIRDLFHQKYRGSRYSFGYPACPNLEDQTKLFAAAPSRREHRRAPDHRIPAGAGADHLGDRGAPPRRNILWCRYPHRHVAQTMWGRAPTPVQAEQGSARGFCSHFAKYKTINSSSTYTSPIFKARFSQPYFSNPRDS